MSSSILLQWKELSYSYPWAKQAVIENISFTIKEKDFIAITGVSWAWKSTLLHIIAGLVTPSVWSIQWDTHVGISFQKNNLYPRMNVENHLYFWLENSPISKMEKIEVVNNMLVKIGLNWVRKQFPQQLSWWQMQRLSLWIILVYGAPIIAMDEPFSSLDRDTRNDMYKFLTELNKSDGITFVFITHHQEDIDALSNKVWKIEQGRITSIRNREELRLPKN